MTMPLTACPTCGSPVRKVFGNVGIVFKGSGFYKTDSRSGTVEAVRCRRRGHAVGRHRGRTASDSGKHWFRLRRLVVGYRREVHNAGDGTGLVDRRLVDSSTSSSDGGNGKASKADKTPA